MYRRIDFAVAIDRSWSDLSVARVHYIADYIHIAAEVEAVPAGAGKAGVRMAASPDQALRPACLAIVAAEYVPVPGVLHPIFPVLRAQVAVSRAHVPSFVRYARCPQIAFSECRHVDCVGFRRKTVTEHSVLS